MNMSRHFSTHQGSFPQYLKLVGIVFLVFNVLGIVSPMLIRQTADSAPFIPFVLFWIIAGWSISNYPLAAIGEVAVLFLMLCVISKRDRRAILVLFSLVTSLVLYVQTYR